MSPKAITNQINFDLLFKNNPLPMWIYDLKTLAFLEVNDAAVKKYGYSRKKFLSMTLKDIRPKEDVERLIKDVSKKRPALQQSQNWRHKLKSRKVIDVEITSHTIKYNGRKAALVTARDITDQKNAEEKINKLNKVYSVLSDVNQTIVRTRNAKELFNSICRIAVDKGGFEMAWIGMLNNEDKKVKVIASAGVTNDYLKKINIDLNDKKRGGGPTGLAVKTGKHVISNNIESDKRMLPWRKDAIKYGYKSSASFPIKVFGKVVGAFNLYSSQPFFFTDEEINLLDEMVMDLSFALEFIEEEKVKREAEEKLKITQFGIDHSQIGVYQIDEEGKINYANEQACKSLGYTYEELTSKSILDIDPNFSLKKWKEHRKKIRKKGSGTIETIHKRKDGTEFFVEVSINYFDYGDKKLSFSFAKDITERKQAEDTLRENEERLRTIIETEPECVKIVDRDGRLLEMNAAGLAMLEVESLSEAQQHTLLNFILPEYRDSFGALHKRVMSGENGTLVFEVLGLKGTRRWLETHAAPMRNANGEVTKLLGVTRDITARKRAEEALKKSEERYRLISNLVSDYVFSSSLTEDGSIKLNWVAGAFENITGYTFEEYTARGGWLAALHPDDVEIDRLDMEILRKNKQVVTEVRTITKNGNTVWVRVYAHPVWDDQEKKVIGVYGAVQNITEQKLADEQLRISEITYRGIIDSVTETIYIQDEDGYFLEVNKAAEKMYGYPREFFIGKTPEILSAPNRNDLEFVKTAVQKAFEGKPQQFEFWGIKKDGTIFPKEVSVAPGIYFNQKVVIAVARDITERKRAEEELSNERTLLKNIIDSIPNPIYVKDLNGRRIIANKAEALFAGKKSVEEIIGKTNYELFSYDHAEKSKHDEEEIIKTGKPLENIERNFTSADGKEYWYIGNKVLLKDSKGNPFGILAVNLDITDRKLMEEKLLEKENQMRMIIEGTPQLFFYTQDTKGKVSYISPSVKKITGYSVWEWLNQSHWFVTDNKINEFARQETHAHLRGEFTEGPMLVEVEHADKHPILLEVYESPIIKNKKVVGLQGVAHDISERKRAEETLRESEERFRNLVENINEVFYITNAQGKIGYCSPNIETIIGYSLNEILGNSYLLFVASEDRRLVIDHYLNETAKAISDTTLIFRARSKDGKIIWVEQLTHIVYDTLGNVVEYRNVARDITERIKAQTTLQNERLLLRTLIDNIPDSIYSKDLNYRKTLSNLADLHFIGAESEAEVLGKSDFDIYPKEIAEKFFADDQTVIQTGIPLLNREEFIIDKKKGKRWLLSSKIPLRDKDNRIMGLVGIGRDITERKLAEEELRKSKEELQKFFEDDLSANYISTPEGKLLNCNKTFLNIFGFKSIEEALDFPIEKLYSDSIHRYVFIDLLKKNKKVESFEGEYVSLNGELIYTIENAVAEFDSNGKFIQIRGYIVDITKRKKAEIELRKLSRAVEHSPASVMITNQDGDIEYVNEKFCEVTGYSKEEVLGKNPRILKSGYHDKVFYEEFWNHILSGKDWKGEMQNKKKNGELFWESVLISPLINKDGDITHFVAVKEDVTEKKGMIDELVRAMERAESANKLKDAFIANMSHEIRTPLNGILGLTSIIKDMYAENIKEEDEELFAGIDHSSKRIIRTVDMILNYSRIQTGEFPVIPREIELSSICENLVKEFNTAAKGKALELSFKNKIDKKVILFGDEYSITNSISNLIDNAIKYTNKGFVDIILYNGDEGEVLLDVKDSGIGISEGYIQHIFEPYQQEQMGYGRAYEGVGLGLPIVKKFLGLNNATISVVSKKGEGTTFNINFGKSIKSTVEKLTEEKIIKNVLSQEREDKPTVLIVEDDVINQSTIKRFIDVNYNTVITDNSEGALQILKSKKIDLILMDISIKGDRNGLELTKELKSSKEFSNIPVIAITAHAFDTDRQNALKAGCDDYLSKPFSKKLLLETIGKFI